MTRADALTYADRRLLAATARYRQAELGIAIAGTKRAIHAHGETAHLTAHLERLQGKYDALEKCVEKLMVRR